MKWTERELQEYRENVCNEEVHNVDLCETCTKTKDEINECCTDLYYYIGKWDIDE
jgi:hypothetical protein